ncbi:MAG: hypothetical protein F4X83_08385 [Chloroflexi bacterium]|nr:hypothetical protein [Chloroflexota bacterium]
MSAVNATIPSGTRAGGLAVMAGMVLTLVASLFFPGGPIIDPVDQTDFPAAAAALGANPTLAHAMTLLVIVGMLLYSYGFVELWRLRGRGAGFGVSVLRFGIVASLFSWSVFIVGFGARHSAIYLMQQGLHAGEGTALQAEFAGLAVSSHITMMGLLLAFMVVNPIASILVGLGLAARFSNLNIYMLAAYGLIAIGLGGFINMVLALFLDNPDIVLHLAISQLFLLAGSLCLFVVGAGMCLGRSELVGEDAAS